MTPAQVVRDTFIAMSHKAWVQPSKELFYLFCNRAEGYSAAIKDILGIEIWGEVVRSADMSFPEEVDVCAGIPLYPKFESKQLTNG